MKPRRNNVNNAHVVTLYYLRYVIKLSIIILWFLHFWIVM